MVKYDLILASLAMLTVTTTTTCSVKSRCDHRAGLHLGCGEVGRSPHL